METWVPLSSRLRAQSRAASARGWEPTSGVLGGARLGYVAATGNPKHVEAAPTALTAGVDRSAALPSGDPPSGLRDTACAENPPAHRRSPANETRRSAAATRPVPPRARRREPDPRDPRGSI